MTDEELLEKIGWQIICHSPFEIEHEESESFASNWATQAVIDDIKQTNKLNRIRLIVDSYRGDLINKNKVVEELLKMFEEDDE